MLNRNNYLVRVCSSVDLALLLIGTIAVSSIAGTIIPQGEPIQFYVQRYGVKPTIILELFDITDMYTSFWFQGLLVLFCVNLVICTWVRLPGVFAVIRKDSLTQIPATHATDTPPTMLKPQSEPEPAIVEHVARTLSKLNLRTQAIDDLNHVFLHERGAWSRLGAYIVHASLLLIVSGALAGKFFGYDAFVMITEGEAESAVHQKGKGHNTIPLGFSIFCTQFATEYYENGSPKEYRSDLLVIDEGQTAISKRITVNDPLNYKGVSFYQSSYRPVDNEYKLIVTRETKDISENGSNTQTFFFNIDNILKSDDLGINFKLLTAHNDGHGHGPYQVLFDDSNNNPVTMMLNDHEEVTIDRGDAVYTMTLAQRFATGLKVVKDPGVWIVYLGCALMLIGLYVSFFMSHIRIWIVVHTGPNGSEITLLGKTNKNTTQLEQRQRKIEASLLADATLNLRRI